MKFKFYLKILFIIHLNLNQFKQYRVHNFALFYVYPLSTTYDKNFVLNFEHFYSNKKL